jgi:pimeloyl-[acyl-carrier protein] synthase
LRSVEVHNQKQDTRLRALIAPHFSARRIARLESSIEGIVQDLLHGISQRGEVDFMAHFAIPLPLRVIAGILGVPPGDMPLLKSWTNDLIAGLDSARASDDDRRKVAESLSAMTDYLAGLIGQTHHADDTMIGHLSQMRRECGEPNEEEFLGLCVLMVLAGHETTVNLLGNGLLTLPSNPGQLALLRENSNLMPSAVDEMLRFESPLQRGTYRITTAPYRVGEFTIQQGQQVSAVIGAANRDPEQFPAPDVFDVTRSPNRHLAFGAGVHKCLGERLARAEAKIAFTRLLERFPEMQLLDSAPEWQEKTLFRGLKSLRIRVED